MRNPLLSMLIVVLAPMCASAYEVEIDGRVYAITSGAEHSVGSSVRRIILGDAELSQCRRYRDAGEPSSGGDFVVLYGSELKALYTDAPVAIHLLPFRYSITTSDGDIVCLPYLPSPIFASNFE